MEQIEFEVLVQTLQTIPRSQPAVVAALALLVSCCTFGGPKAPPTTTADAPRLVQVPAPTSGDGSWYWNVLDDFTYAASAEEAFTVELIAWERATGSVDIKFTKLLGVCDNRGCNHDGFIKVSYSSNDRTDFPPNSHLVENSANYFVEFMIEPRQVDYGKCQFELVDVLVQPTNAIDGIKRIRLLARSRMEAVVLTCYFSAAKIGGNAYAWDVRAVEQPRSVNVVGFRVLTREDTRYFSELSSELLPLIEEPLDRDEVSLGASGVSVCKRILGLKD